MLESTTVEDTVKSFPSHDVQPIEGGPKCAILKPFEKELRKCAEAVPSHQEKGCSCPVVTEEKYKEIVKKKPLIPTRPPINPKTPLKATTNEINTAVREHARDVKIYHSHQIMTEALKKIITENINKVHLADIDIRASTVLEILDYLKTRYYKISIQEITQNERILRELWDPSAPIEEHFQRIKDCVELSEDAIEAENISEKTQIQVMLASMERVRKFKQNNKDWKKKKAADKTLKNFHQHHIDAHEEMLEDEECEEEENEAHNAVTSDPIQMPLSQNKVEEQGHMATNDKLEGSVETLIKKVAELETGKPTQQKTNGGQGTGKGPMAWRRVAPKEGEPTEKTVNEKLFKCCEKCRRGQGLWTTGDGLHGTAEHDPNESTRS